MKHLFSADEATQIVNTLKARQPRWPADMMEIVEAQSGYELPADESATLAANYPGSVLSLPGSNASIMAMELGDGEAMFSMSIGDEVYTA